jgi:endonuclease YncB( thermonuclease family)
MHQKDSQLCRGEDSSRYRCCALAANDLDAFIARRPVSCVPLNLDPYGRPVATCSVGGADLGEWLVRNGLALDWPQYSKGKYGEAQRDAERLGQGICKGQLCRTMAVSDVHPVGRHCDQLLGRR